MVKKVAKRIVETRCSECGISASEAQLVRIKGTDLYICEYCEPSIAISIDGDDDNEYGNSPRQQEESSDFDYDYE